MNNKCIKIFDKFISFGLACLPLLIALSFYLRTYDSCQIKITIMQIGVTLIFSLWFIKKANEQLYHPENHYFFAPLNYFTIAIICFLLSGIFSYFISSFKAASLEELIKRMLYMAVFFVVLSQADKKESIKNFLWPLLVGTLSILAIFNADIFYSSGDLRISIIRVIIIFFALFFIFRTIYRDKEEENIDKIIRWIILSAFLVIVYGLLQYVDGSNFGPIRFVRQIITDFFIEEHLDPFLWRNAFGYRIFSTFGNPNFFSAFLVLVSPLIFMQFLKTKNRKFIIIFFLGLICIILSVTKASWIGFAAGSFCCVVLSVIGFRLNKQFKKILIIGLLVINLAAIYGVTYYSRQRIDSLRFRIFTWSATLEMIKKHPVVGSGIGTFKIVYPTHRMPEIFHIEGKHNTETDHPENEFLEILYDEGIIGFVIFMCILYLFFSKGIKKIIELAAKGSGPDKKESGSPPEKLYQLIGILSGIFGMLVHNLMCVNMRFVSSGFFFWLFLGLGGNIIFVKKEITNKDSALNETDNSSPSGLLLIKTRFFQISIILLCLGLTLPFWPYGFFTRLFIADKHHNMAIAYSKNRIWDKALEEYEQVIKYNPFYIMAYYFMGNVYKDRNAPGDQKQALLKYAKAKMLAPNYVQVHLHEGLVFLSMAEQFNRQGEKDRAKVYYEKALNDFNKARALDPVFGPIYIKIAWCNIQLGRYKEAKEILQIAIETKGPNNTNRFYADSYINLANIFTLENNFVEAEINFKKAIELDPDYIMVHKNLAILYTRSKETKKAIIEWEKVLQLNPDDKLAISNLDKLKASTK